MDTSRKAETREATQQLAKRCEVDRTNMGAVRTDGQKKKQKKNKKKKTGSGGEQSMAYAPGGAKGLSK
jgi:hypothetical protein